MGISSLLKGITWTSVAGMALEYGPGLYRKAMERFQPATPPVACAEPTELLERVARLEKLLLEQEGVIREQQAKNASLEKDRLELASQLLMFKIIAGVLTLGCIILLAVLFK